MCTTHTTIHACSHPVAESQPRIEHCIYHMAGWQRELSGEVALNNHELELLAVECGLVMERRETRTKGDCIPCLETAAIKAMGRKREEEKRTMMREEREGEGG
jgi:hypothetical protein